MKISLDGKEITTINPYGLHPLDLIGEYSKDSLKEELIKRWIPYYECHKCGRSDYCKFTIPHEHVRGKLKDIQCGVVVSVMKNFIEQTFKLLHSYSNHQLQEYFDGLYYFQKFIYQTELETGLFLDNEALNYYQEHSPKNYGNLLYVRHYLDEIGKNLKSLPEFGATKGLLFVEGKTEEVFIKRLIANGDFSAKQFIIHSYDGKSNKSEKKIKLLIERNRDVGYDIFIQGDKDGEGIDVFQNHINSGLIAKNQTFLFEHDFETSIPIRLLHGVLTTLHILDVDVEDFVTRVESKSESINKTIEEEFGVSLKPHKTDIADALGVILRHLNWRTNKSIHNSELGQFLEFVYRI